MGIFDSIKSALGKGKAEPEATVAPSQALREAGIDPKGLKFGFGNRSITVSGAIAQESDRQKIVGVLSGLPGIDAVQDKLDIVASAASAPAKAVAPDSVASEPAAAEPPSVQSPQAETAAPPDEGEGRTYTVVSGDTLWRIAEREYGNGSKYMKIFEANKDILENPDRIFPGQKLRIPEL